MSFSISQLSRFFSSYQNLEKFYIAYSGGLDSTVLLHAMHAAKLPIHAVHINHHLQAFSNDWQKHCVKFCSDLSIPIIVKDAQITKQPQQSLEDIARQARYTLLMDELNKRSALVTAHHQDDVAETVLLQLLRGAGAAGMAAMPASKKLALGIHLRPLLAYSRADLLEYAKKHDLHWVEDPSNESTEFDRNYLRKEVMPMIAKRWPSASQTLSRAAELQAQALNCLHDLGEIDIQAARTNQPDVLEVTALQALSAERLNNVLRYWIRSNDIRMPSKKIMQRIVKDIVHKEEIETSPLQTWKEGEIRRFRNLLYLMRPLKPHDASQVFCWKIDQPLFIESLERTLSLEELEAQDIMLPDGVMELTVKFREGGERLKPFGSKQHRSLKNLLQEADIPPWERVRIPMLYHQDQLLSVLGYWNCSQP